MTEIALTHILLVEDSPADVRITLEALKDSKIANDVHVARDGVEALEFLRREGPHANAARPDLIILDLNLPRVDGKEVLREMRADPSLSTIPVAVLTTSEEEHDVVESYRLGANCYLTKPVGLEQLLKVVHSVEEFWLGIVRLPSRSDPI